MKYVDILIVAVIASSLSLSAWILFNKPTILDCVKWDHVVVKHGDHEHRYLKCLKLESHWTPPDGGVAE